MKQDFYLPDIGEGIVECELVEWLVAEGERVAEDQAICDVMTDKALVQIPAVHGGTITRLHVAKGEMARVHAPLFEMEIEDRGEDNRPAAPVSAAPGSKDEIGQDETGQEDQADRTPAVSAPPESVPGNGAKAVASPAVRRLAREHDLELGQVPGSGDKGRVYKEDIEAYLAGRDVGGEPAPAVTGTVAEEAGEVEPLRGVRAAMARQMTASLGIPQFTFCDELSLGELLRLKEKLKVSFAEEGVRLTLLAFFIKALSLALKDFPLLNSRLDAEATGLIRPSGHHIGVAVDTEAGLLVPNIKHCEQKSLLAIAAELERLGEAARAGRLSQAELQGGTITLSNIGVLGGIVSSPVVRPPELAIAALGRLQRLPRFNEAGEVVAQQLMMVCWSADHRVIDGATLARFNQCWRQYLEQPERMLARLA
ncbi:dihydrolipoamide acetyltransferase [Zobellella endophytica]|uniref:Dihydrolipoamide acetyltransferase component of pyruvate dehydrogenase complex n=1 Tax=Zobellella endophytica TaxID=2116700 RepID=A0A2P7R3X4_9GAMM|nr:2-oxo acid dehydrogenase subunit E2 [Zobellella endophytica]PSJ44917.1 dihydrolipoamide acetyltransferase [Zobellella endophytica]